MRFGIMPCLMGAQVTDTNNINQHTPRRRRILTRTARESHDATDLNREPNSCPSNVNDDVSFTIISHKNLDETIGGDTLRDVRTNQWRASLKTCQWGQPCTEPPISFLCLRLSTTIMLPVLLRSIEWLGIHETCTMLS